MTGGIVQPLGSTSVGGVTGQILCVYKTTADSAHVTTWHLDGGGARPVQVLPGTPVKSINVGQHTITFTPPAGDTAPPTQTFQLAAGELKTLKVYYS